VVFLCAGHFSLGRELLPCLVTVNTGLAVIEWLKAKFERGGCRFEVEISFGGINELGVGDL
jgi:hypothetical protein